MLKKLLKIIIDSIDYFIAHQVPSKMGYGHQINSRKALGQNSYFIIKTIAIITKPLKIIELATGRGVLAKEILKLNNIDFYLACDIDPSGLEFLEKKVAKEQYSTKLKTKVMNVLKPDLKNNEYFDIVIADKFLHLLSPKEILDVFNLSYDLLIPGGLLFISSASENNVVYSRTDPTDQHKLYRKLKEDLLTRLWYNITKPYVFFINDDYIQKIAAQTGFLYNERFVCVNKDNYLTLALCKKPPNVEQKEDNYSG